MPDQDHDPFDAAVAAAIETLPEPYRGQLESVAIVVQDEPSPDQLASVDARGLLGLYQGVERLGGLGRTAGREGKTSDAGNFEEGSAVHLTIGSSSVLAGWEGVS